MYNILLNLSRNIFFYNEVKLPDNFESRIYLMFIHFSIMMIIAKKKGSKFDQNSYDILFNKIEYDLRELGFGDVTVNKKMKELNKILYDILLKLDKSTNTNKFELNSILIYNYFNVFNNDKNPKYTNFEDYFNKFYNFCFELPLDSMIEGCINFKY